MAPRGQPQASVQRPDEFVQPGADLATAELVDPTTGRFSPAPPLNDGRFSPRLSCETGEC